MRGLIACPMATSLTSSTPMPWEHPQALQLPWDLGPGVQIDALRAGLDQLSSCDGIRAMVVFGSRARGEATASSDLDLAVICREEHLGADRRGELWSRYRKALGAIGCGVDLVLQGQGDAARFSESRWHVMKDVRRHGVVIYAAE